MNIKQLFEDEDAVSPVIGVILMVAITVILAAVIGTFVLGLGDQVQNNAPSANFQFDYNSAGDQVDITHNGGDTIDATTITVSADSETAGDTAFGSSTISTGSTATGIACGSVDTVRIIWNNPNGQSSQTIGSSEVPS